MARAAPFLMGHDVIQVEFAGRDLWVVAHDVVDKGVEAGQRFTATIQDMDTGRLILADGRFDELEYSTLNHVPWQRTPHDDEFGWAVDLLKEKLKELGGTVLDGPEDSPFGRLATVQDPQGASFQIIQIQE